MRLMMWAGLALAAIPVAAQAQTEPALNGPFYELAENERGTSVIALGSRVREGNVARITRILMLSAPAKASDMDVWRLDATAEYDCTKRLTRPLVLAARDEKGNLLHIFETGDAFEPLPEDDPTAAVVMATACDGKSPANGKRIDDFNAYQKAFRAKG